VSQLVTGEAVALDLRTAGVPSRLLASALDLLVQMVALFLLSMLFGAVASTGNEAQAAAMFIVVLLLVGLGYPVLLETLLRGRTLGKMALGLRVVRDDGGPIRFRHAFVRGLVGLIVEKPGISWGAVGVLTALLNERGKRLGDFAAGTIVIQERVVSAPPGFVPMPPPLAGWATTLDLTRLPDDLALSARGFLMRHTELTPAAQQALGSQLAAAVAAVVTPEPPAGTPDWAYLSAVLAERRRRAEQAAWGVAPQPVGGYGYYGTPPPPVSPPAAPPPGPPPPPAADPRETGGFAPPS
jgi:uncharacterized RDD family membrane protein YckC